MVNWQIIVSAMVATLSWAIIASIYNLATTSVEYTLTPQIQDNPTAQKALENGKTADELESNAEDLKTLKNISSGKRSLDATVYFGMPMMIGLLTFVGLSAKGSN